MQMAVTLRVFYFSNFIKYSGHSYFTCLVLKFTIFLQFLHNIATSCYLGKSSCLLCDQLDSQCSAIVRNVYNNVSPLQAAIILDYYVCKSYYLLFSFSFPALGTQCSKTLEFCEEVYLPRFLFSTISPPNQINLL